MKLKNKNWNSYYQISFEVLSHRDPLSEISKRMGCIPSSGSCDIGDYRGGEKIKYSWWRWFTNLSKKESLDKHFESLISKIEKSKVFKKTP